MLGGEWFHCQDCATCGDMLDFTGFALKTDIAGSLAWLREHMILRGPDPTAQDIADYVAWYVERRASAKDFRDKTQARLRLMERLSPTQREIVGARQSNWAELNGRFLGAVSYEEAEAFTAPRKLNLTLKKPSKPSRISTTPDELLVLPMSDLPGRISAFVFAAGDGETDEVNCVTAMSTRLYESRLAKLSAGVTMWPNMELPTHPLLEEALFVFLDPFLAARLQAFHFYHEHTPLPLVAVWPSASPTAWLREHNTNRELIFWAEEPTADLFRHARAAAGKVAFNSAQLESTWRHITRYARPEDWLDIKRRHALPWDAALEQHLDGLPTADAWTLLGRLSLSEDELFQFVSECNEPLRNRLTPFFKARSLNGKAILNGKTIVETQRGWEIQGTGELVSEATLRITHLIRQTEEDLTYYQGHIRYHDEELPFSVASDKLDRKGLHWMRDHLLDLGKSVPYFNPRWASDAVALSQQFHRPDVVQAPTQYGWDPRLGGWVFPRFVINKDGQVVRHRVNLPHEPSTPAFAFEPPEPLGPETLEALADSRAWPLFFTVVYALLGKVMNYPAFSLAVVGDHAESYRTQALSLGCPLAESSSGWPWLPKKDVGAGTVVAVLPEHVALTHVIRGGWRLMDPKKPAPAAANALTKALPRFLQRLTPQRRFYAAPWLNLSVDIADWFRSEGGDASVIPAGLRMLRHEELLVNFGELLACLFLQGLLLTTRSDFEESNKRKLPYLIYDAERSEILVPKAGINRLVVQDGGLPLPISQITEALQNASLLLRELDFRREPVWAVPEAWWFACLTQRKTRGTPAGSLSR